MEIKGAELIFTRGPEITFPEGPRFKAVDSPEFAFDQNVPRLINPKPPEFVTGKKKRISIKFF